jgi:hypothetical protein
MAGTVVVMVTLRVANSIKVIQTLNVKEKLQTVRKGVVDIMSSKPATIDRQFQSIGVTRRERE